MDKINQRNLDLLTVPDLLHLLCLLFFTDRCYF
jgi:hypothetical protein